MGNVYERERRIRWVIGVSDMGRIDVILPEELEGRFRMEAGRRLGAKRGAFTEAVIEALNDWADPDLAKVIEEYRAQKPKAKGGSKHV